MKHLALAMFAVLAYTTAMEWTPEQTGYSKADEKRIGRLVELVLLEPQAKGKWSATRQRDALASLWKN